MIFGQITLTLEAKTKKIFFKESLNDQMPDAGRQIREVRVPRDVELTPFENRSEQEKNKDNEKEK